MEGKPEFINENGAIVRKDISEQDKKLLIEQEFPIADGNVPENDFQDEDSNQKIFKEITQTALDNPFSTMESISQKKIENTIGEIKDAIDAIELQLEYQDRKLGEIAVTIRNLEALEMSLSDKAMVLKSDPTSQNEDINLVKQMNKVGQEIDELEEKYEKMADIATKNSAKLTPILERLRAKLSYSYDSEKAYDQSDIDKSATYLKN